MKTSKSFKKIISLLVVIVLVLSAAQYLLFHEIKSKNQNISRMQNDINLQDSRQDYLVSMQNILDDLAPDLNNLNNSIVKSGVDGNVEFIEYLESLAKENGIDIGNDNLSIEDIQGIKNTNVSLFKIKSNTKGAWKGTYAFLAQLESLSYRVRINKFSLTNITEKVESDTKNQPQLWQTVMEISVLKYK